MCKLEPVLRLSSSVAELFWCRPKLHVALGLTLALKRRIKTSTEHWPTWQTWFFGVRVQRFPESRRLPVIERAIVVSLACTSLSSGHLVTGDLLLLATGFHQGNSVAASVGWFSSPRVFMFCLTSSDSCFFCCFFLYLNIYNKDHVYSFLPYIKQNVSIGWEGASLWTWGRLHELPIARKLAWFVICENGDDSYSRSVLNGCTNPDLLCCVLFWVFFNYGIAQHRCQHTFDHVSA